MKKKKSSHKTNLQFFPMSLLFCSIGIFLLIVSLVEELNEAFIIATLFFGLGIILLAYHICTCKNSKKR